MAMAVSSLVDALKDVPQACLHVGSLLMVKTTGDDGKSTVSARTLTAVELRLLEENQPMLRYPDRILEWFSSNLVLDDSDPEILTPRFVRKLILWCLTEKQNPEYYALPADYSMNVTLMWDRGFPLIATSI
jgi:hypothetical protein